MKAFGIKAMQRSDQNLLIIFINGTMLKGDFRDLIRWLAEPTTFLLYALAHVVFLIYFAYLGRADFMPEEVWQIGLTVIVFVNSFFLFVVLLVGASFLIAQFTTSFIMPVTLVIVVAHVANQIIAVEFVKQWDITVPDSALLYLRIIKIYVLVLMLEVFYSVYLLPKSSLYRRRLFIDPNLRGSKTSETALTRKPQERMSSDGALTQDGSSTASKISSDEPVVLGGQEFDQRKIKIINAEQNYIRVQTDTETTLVRAPMSAAVKLLSASLGVQAHRSCWVSFAMVADKRSLSNGRLALDLTNGDTITVPRARRRAVLQALETYT